MKTVVAKNCSKKVTSQKKKEVMLDIGTRAFIETKPKVEIGIRRTQKMQ